MKRFLQSSSSLPRVFTLFFVLMTLVSVFGGYQLSRLIYQMIDYPMQRAEQLLVAEMNLDDAAIELGMQIQEWKDMLLRANDTFVGAVGLLEYVSPRRPERAAGEDRPIVGDFIMVVNASDLDTRWDKVKAVPGVKVLSEPSRIEYPAPGGQGVIPVMVTMVRDPDGYFVELNQILGTPAGAEER